MDHSFSQSQSLRQEQTLSARQLQSLELLHAPILELQERLSQELAANPVLEEVPSDTDLQVGDPLSVGAGEEEPHDAGDESLASEQLVREAENWHDELPLPAGAFSGAGEGDGGGGADASDRDFFFDSLTGETTLQELLLDELRLSNVDERQHRIGELVIGSIDDSGYLRTHPADIAMAADASLEEVEQVVRLIQSFDPPGVGAFTPGECLRLQLERRGEKDPRLFELIDRYLDDIGNNRLPQIARAMKISLPELERLLEKLRTLHPYPGSVLSPSGAVFVAPELEIVREGERYVVKPSGRSMRLRIPERYWKMLEDPALSAADRAYIRDKIAAARELIRALEMRESTIRRIAAVIADEQHEFFEKGVAFLHPMTMRDVAEKLNLHETTVSRAIAGKYLQTPRGFFEFRYFFSSGFHAADGTAVSSRSVQEAIRHLIDGEDARKPLSDEKISQLLRKEGLEVARRTVAKYREEMRIPPTPLRRSHH